MRALGIALLLSLMLGCAGTGADKDRSAPRSPTPQQVVDAPQRHGGKLVEWGGVILESRNLRERSELEILAYPLRGSGRPEPERPPLGRFIGIRPGYVETANFAPGRLVTLIGPIAGVRGTRIGEAEQSLPELEIQDAYLWTVPPAYERPRFRLGIGGGNRGVGVGIGIGL